ncbi:hypothetical protein L226DRAFT_91358 [Lentinus tigrinus ALCF2SS1-7]|uniref:Uncharacterized protein n=1 Tax=Lentinus tigrinus ALCF2SS1-6 TaxID=1328759 RepID=A0A5C2RYU0_9APHY|nr:hypothetical protein L227DRAFT_288755 [Lentinus tigrinus ALCF2SS1-6]RPD73942.1 hypothetical protein L226DRAFT_91358 [Lentinus tigrinus ALCF2SS1-7]
MQRFPQPPSTDIRIRTDTQHPPGAWNRRHLVLSRPANANVPPTLHSETRDPECRIQIVYMKPVQPRGSSLPRSIRFDTVSVHAQVAIAHRASPTALHNRNPMWRGPPRIKCVHLLYSMYTLTVLLTLRLHISHLVRGDGESVCGPAVLAPCTPEDGPGLRMTSCIVQAAQEAVIATRALTKSIIKLGVRFRSRARRVERRLDAQDKRKRS